MSRGRARPVQVHRPSVVAGTVFVLLGVLFLSARLLDASVDAGLVVPMLLIGLGVAGLVRTSIRAVTPARSETGAEEDEDPDPVARALREEARRELEDLDGVARATAVLADAPSEPTPPTAAAPRPGTLGTDEGAGRVD